MEKITFSKLREIFYEHNEQKNISGQDADKNSLIGVVVFKQGQWFKKEYTELERSYSFSSDCKYFNPGKCGNSIFASCLDGTDPCIRLDAYLGKWEIDYCYIKEK